MIHHAKYRVDGQEAADGFTEALSVPSNVSNSMSQSNHQSHPTDGPKLQRPWSSSQTLPFSCPYTFVQDAVPAAGVGHGGSGC